MNFLCASVGFLHANPPPTPRVHTIQCYVLRIKSLSEICRRLPSAEAMLVVVLLLLLG